MKIKKVLSLVLCVCLLACVPASADAEVAPRWISYMDSAEYAAAITMYPGTDETERNIRWYSAVTDTEPKVILDTDGDLSDGEIFTGRFVVNPQGDHSNFVSINGLSCETTYYYQCITESFSSPVYSFTTASETEFTALYMTDIHIDKNEEDDPDAIARTSSKFAQELESAYENSNIDLLLSAGDQATEGLREQYEGFAASPLVKTFAVATAVGNHDRKGIDYRYFNAVPNEQKMFVGNFICNDYFFKKGDVLFVVFDSNNGSGVDHENCIKNALKTYPDCKWRVAMFHHDLYGQRIESREKETSFMRLLWYPMLDQYKFDLVLLGHSHYFTVSNVLYNNETVEKVENNGTVKDAAGTIYMVSGSTNHPRGADEGEDIPLGERIEEENAVITSDAIYNIIDFTEDSITVKSYTMESGDVFHTFTIEKTDADGGHPEESCFKAMLLNVRNWFVRVIGTIYAFFNIISVINRLHDKGIDDVCFCDSLMNGGI